MTLEEIKQTYTMRDILARYGLEPNRAGFIRCPFHPGDRQASLKVYGRDFHCFGCGANGDVIDFVRLMEGISFADAFRELGGTFQPSNRMAQMIRKARAQRERQDRQAAEQGFVVWHRERLTAVCRLLQLLDELIPQLEPLGGEWTEAVGLRERNEYKYQVLAFGSRQEQEEMRARDE